MIFRSGSGRHVRVERVSPWRVRRWQVIGAMVTMLIGTGVALAILFSRMDSAPQTITARSIGAVDIGNAASAPGLFTVDLSRIEPGFQTCQGVVSVLTNPQTGDAPMLWVAAGSGALADDVEIRVIRMPSVPAGEEAAGRYPCQLVAGDKVFDWGKLQAFTAFAGTYETGFPWDAGPRTKWQIDLRLPATVDAGAVAGESATLSLAFENRGS